jgi:hypothetical protein
MSKQRFSDVKVSSAKEVLWFDFSERLVDAEELSGVSSVAVTVEYGTDNSPSAILNGAAALTTDKKGVLVPVQAGVAGVDYAIKVLATTTNPAKVVGMIGVLAVRN